MDDNDDSSGRRSWISCEWKKATMEGSTIVIIKNGRIEEGWNHMDIGGLLAQLKTT